MIGQKPRDTETTPPLHLTPSTMRLHLHVRCKSQAVACGESMPYSARVAHVSVALAGQETTTTLVYSTCRETQQIFTRFREHTTKGVSAMSARGNKKVVFAPRRDWAEGQD
eukprot:scaffold1954_cov268-Pinguiococcus_pyrenoidosus.AAC.47